MEKAINFAIIVNISLLESPYAYKDIRELSRKPYTECDSYLTLRSGTF